MILGWGDKETGDCCRRCWGLESVCKAPGGRCGWSWVVLLCAGDASPLIPFSCSPGGNSAVHARPLSGEHAVSRADLAQLGAACPVSPAPGAPRKPWPCWREPSEPQRARPRSRSQPARGQRPQVAAEGRPAVPAQTSLAPLLRGQNASSEEASDGQKHTGGSCWAGGTQLVSKGCCYRAQGRWGTLFVRADTMTENDNCLLKPSAPSWLRVVHESRLVLFPQAGSCRTQLRPRPCCGYLGLVSELCRGFKAWRS